MPNIKVASEKRKRVSKACNMCRTRKQKCDGLRTCKYCRTRGLHCVYRPSKSTESSSDSTASCSPPRHDLGEQSPEAAEHSDTPRTNGKTASQYATRRSASPGKVSSFRIVSTSRPEEFGKYTHPRTASEHQQRSQTLITLHLPLLKPPAFYDCYATESFVALVKQRAKLVSGSSDFTESCIWSGPQQTSPARSYPTWPPDLAQITITRLLNSYFSNAETHGFINVVDLESVEAIMRQIYDGPTQMCNSDRCTFFLVLAIGLAFDSSPTEIALQDPDLKERFFASADALLQPSETYRGPESCNSVPWILQALVLMSFYMLCVSRPHAAHSYCSRAFQVAHSFGIHRGKETEAESFSGTQAWIVPRRNVWRSLFVLDRFLAATLGRPLTIHQHTEESLVLQKGTLLNPAVDACRIIGETVKVIYSGSKISMKDVKLLIGHLDSLTDAKVDPAPFVAQARVNSFRIYADILLCRPFFLLRFIASKEECETLDRIEPQIKELSQRCVSGSIRAIDMIKEGTRPTSPLPVDPFLPCVLIEATYVLLCSMYAGIHVTGEHLSLVKEAMVMLGTVKKTNSYAGHSASVLDLFLLDVNRQNHSMTVKPDREGHAYQAKTELITAYEFSQCRSPFYPPTQSNSVPPYDSRRRPTTEGRNFIKQESQDHSNAFASMSFPPHTDSSTFRHQPSAGNTQRSWHDERSCDMEIDGSQCGRFE